MYETNLSMIVSTLGASALSLFKLKVSNDGSMWEYWIFVWTLVLPFTARIKSAWQGWPSDGRNEERDGPPDAEPSVLISTVDVFALKHSQRWSEVSREMRGNLRWICFDFNSRFNNFISSFFRRRCRLLPRNRYLSPFGCLRLRRISADCSRTRQDWFQMEMVSSVRSYVAVGGRSPSGFFTFPTSSKGLRSSHRWKLSSLTTLPGWPFFGGTFGE